MKYYLFIAFTICLFISLSCVKQTHDMETSNFVRDTCIEEDWYIDTLNVLSKEYICTINKTFGIKDLDSALVFYYLPSFKNEQVCIVNLKSVDPSVITMSSADSSVWARVGKRAEEDIYSPSFCSKIKNVKVVSDTFIWNDSVEIDSILELNSITRRCKPPSDLLLITHDGIEYVVSVYIEGKIIHSFEFADQSYQDKRYKRLVDVFRKYLFKDNN